MYCCLFAVLLECGTPNPPDDNSLMKIDVTKIIGFPVSNGQVIVEGADSTMAGDGDCFGKNDGVLEVKNTYAEASKSLACNAADHDSTAQVNINYTIYCLSLPEQCCALLLST